MCARRLADCPLAPAWLGSPAPPFAPLLLLQKPAAAKPAVKKTVATKKKAAPKPKKAAAPKPKA